MGVKVPSVRRTDSLYAQIGGKANIGAIVDRFYEKMVADPDIRPLLAKANLAALKQQQALFLTNALSGPADPRNRVTPQLMRTCCSSRNTPSALPPISHWFSAR